MVIVLADLEGDHDLPLDCSGVARQLENFSNNTKYRCGDYYIQEKSSMRYCQEVIKREKKKEDEHEDQNNSHTGLVKVSSMSKT